MTSASVEATRLLLASQVSEADFQRDVIDFAKRRGWLVQHSRPAYNKSGRISTPLQGHKGFPDLVLVRDRVLFVELKKVGAYPTPEQRTWIARLQALQGDYVRCLVWRPTDWPEIEAVLS
jgi:hypothetical protein